MGMKLPRTLEGWLPFLVLGLLLFSSLGFTRALLERPLGPVNYLLIALFVAMPFAVFAYLRRGRRREMRSAGYMRSRRWDRALVQTVILVIVVQAAIATIVCFTWEVACASVEFVTLVAGGIYVYRRHFHA